MSILDLNKPLDFARATMGDVGSLLSLFANRDPKEWNLLEGSYTGGSESGSKVIFHVFASSLDYGGALDRISDTGGRRKVKYMFPYVDGQTTDDLGRKPESFTVNIVLFGNNYMNALRDLMLELNDPVPGELIHPVRGQIRAAAEDVSLLHQSSERKAVAIQVTFIEHNFTIGQFRSFEKDKTNKNALAQALAVFQKIDNAILAIRGAIIFVNNVKTSIETLLNNFKTNSATTLQRMNLTFNASGSSVDIPTLLPTNKGGSAVGGTFATVTSPSDPFAALPLDELQSSTVEAVSIQQLEKNVNQLREDVQEIIDLIENSAVVPGYTGIPPAIVFYDTIVELKNSAILMQEVLETGVASSQTKIIDYLVPRDMSIREVAFACGLRPDDGREIAMLNPSLLSLNFIAEGTALKVPVS